MLQIMDDLIGVILKIKTASFGPLEKVRIYVNLQLLSVLIRPPGILGNGRNVVDTDLSRQPTS
nr:hypothetical protein [Lactiplantibacillus pentosus]